MNVAEPTTTVVDASGVGPGGITRTLTEVVRHWPAGQRLVVVAAPAGWQLPAGHVAEVELLSRQVAGRGQAIGRAAASLRAITGRLKPGARVLSMSPSAAILGSRLPVTTVVHDLAFRLWPHDLSAAVRRYRQISYGTAVRRSSLLICVSARTRHDLAGLYAVPEERTAVWHPGSDLAASPGDPPAPLVELRRRGGSWLVVAGHAPHKGVELAVDALPSLPGQVLVVLTGGNRVQRYDDAVRRAGVADRVLFLDHLPESQYAATVGGAAAFLMPSHFEGYGLPAAEALRLGTPTVVSPDPALHEATGGRAVRMTAWTPQALVAAVTEAAARPRPTPDRHGRSWRTSVAELADLIAASAGPRPAAARATR
ncbi:glycosyltransferase [Micromonospora terminaliae]|uniref:Glycosyltransferase n=1 Tax=Micromonospora terminaliae TaxID=1914461 RepID=A0AAJ2ZJI9_9ACTN|nr:glycosyltransferase family 1 protein [Micromonospora terminaliae]NES30896.1 glycosyltransferase family 4 protein [Micromonospora terminaliae]QGL45597.1 glycosyltransferase [Micromonospora terminaliae]